MLQASPEGNLTTVFFAHVLQIEDIKGKDEKRIYNTEVKPHLNLFGCVGTSDCTRPENCLMNQESDHISSANIKADSKHT